MHILTQRACNGLFIDQERSCIEVAQTVTATSIAFPEMAAYWRTSRPPAGRSTPPRHDNIAALNNNPRHACKTK
jgi:hypothetical protein